MELSCISNSFLDIARCSRLVKLGRTRLFKDRYPIDGQKTENWKKLHKYFLDTRMHFIMCMPCMQQQIGTSKATCEKLF